MPFFHGTQVDDVAALLISISQVNGSTIALVGTAPEGPAGMTLVSSPKDAAQFGESVFDGRTIPHALDAIIAQGASQVVVINCFKSGHLTNVPAEAVAVPAGFIVPLVHVPVGVIVVSTATPTTLVAGTDYSYKAGDKFFTILNRTTYPATTALLVDYSYFDKTLVLSADIIGGINGGTGVRTGIALLDLAYATTGLTPKIIIAPTYCEAQTVNDALLAQATKLRARVINDAPNTLTVATAIAARGIAGTYANWDSGNPRLICVFPYVNKPDPLNPQSAGQPFPYSAYFAGLWAASINKNGIQRSPSNLPLAGFTSSVIPISCGIGDNTSDASLLNAQGINTIYTGFGTGPKSWGNRSAAFPALNTIATFMSVHFVQDIIDESVQMASLAFQDLPLDLALIDSIVSAVNGFINTLILSKALIGGEAYYDPTLNTPSQLATGFVIISYRDLPPPPAEGILFQSLIDISIFTSAGLAG